MVYCGRPSKGCSNCRLRRIKCDRKDPSCSQCTRAGKSCPGYRDQLSLMFRDENATVVRRLRGPEKSLEPDSLPEKVASSTVSPRSSNPIARMEVQSYSTSSSEIDFSNPKLQAILSTPYPLALDLPSLEHKGLAFFFTHYASPNTPFTDRSLNSKISPLLTGLQRSKPFFDAVSSVGLAGLSNVTKDKSLMLAAEYKHAETLSHVASVLSDLKNANLEETLKEVLLLGVFELVGGDEHPSRRRGLHVDGAAALLRTITQNEATKRSAQTVVRMQLQFCFILFTRYFEIGRNIPPEISETVQSCREVQHHEDLPAANLVMIVAQFIEFHSRIKISELFDPETIIESALICEAELEQWEQQLPDDWKSEVRFLADQEPTIYRDYYHTYRDIWTARIWGHYHWVRILVNEIVLTQLAKLEWHTLEHDVQRTKCLQTIARIAMDICTSIPSQLFHNSTWYLGGPREPMMAGVFLILFPLAVAGGASGVPDDLHLWVVKLLEHIGHTMGVRRALELIPSTQMHRAKAKMGETGSCGWQ